MKAVLNDLYQMMSESCAEVFAFKKVRKEKKIYKWYVYF